jgi:UTP--glucose-1-phosphate uridylyltransferase
MNKITKAIIPVAGLGTRMLPATKAIPKELLPVFDKPIIQHVVEEAINSGIKEIIFVTRSGKEAIENHFDVNYELEHRLDKKGKKKILGSIKNVIPKEIKISSVRQENALGLGHAILCAKHLIGNESFAVFLPDELLISKSAKNSFFLMMKAWNETEEGQIMVEKISKINSDRYGMVDLNKKVIVKNESKKIFKLVEKPSSIKSPSNCRVVGRYILPNQVMSYLQKTKIGKDGEIQLTDALDSLLKSSSLNAFLTDSEIFDCGEKKGFIGANIALAKQDSSMKKYMEKIINN